MGSFVKLTKTAIELKSELVALRQAAFLAGFAMLSARPSMHFCAREWSCPDFLRAPREWTNEW